MIPQLVSRSLSVDQTFAAPFLFVSPGYQRPFAWQVDTAERLLSDIQVAAESAPDEIYFLGAILLVRVRIADEQAHSMHDDTLFTGPERVFEIVDGQQRIVTLAMLLAVLRDLTAQERSPLARRLARASGAAKGAAVADGGSAGMARVRLRGQDDAFLDQCIGAAGACLALPAVEAVGEPQRRILEIRDFFVRQLSLLDADELRTFATFVLDNCALVAIVTNTIDRAYQMFTVLNDAGEPLTRGDILKAELIGQIAPAERERAIAVWDDLERRLGGDFEQLFSFVRTQAGRGAGPIVEAVRAQVAAMPGGAGDFVFDVLAPAGDIVGKILQASHSGTAQSSEISRLLRYLGWLSGKEWVPPLLAFWRRHGDDPAALLRFLAALDRFAFGVRMQGLSADKRAQRMAALTTQIEGGMAMRGPWPSLQFTRDETRAIEFSQRDLHKRSPLVCRLVLMRLDEHFGGTPLPAGTSLTIEHILPLKIAPGSQWRLDFPDAETRQKLASCLGNLALVTSAVNERAANHDFSKKVTFYFTDGKSTESYLTAELYGVKTWTPHQIEQRLLRLSSGLNAMWRFNEHVSTR